MDKKRHTSSAKPHPDDTPRDKQPKDLEPQAEPHGAQQIEESAKDVRR